jgi:hypothetical protein
MITKRSLKSSGDQLIPARREFSAELEWRFGLALRIGSSPRSTFSNIAASNHCHSPPPRARKGKENLNRRQVNINSTERIEAPWD